jgi:hypothetical protein
MQEFVCGTAGYLGSLLYPLTPSQITAAKGRQEKVFHKLGQGYAVALLVEAVLYK